MLLSDKVCYVHIPRCAGMSITTALATAIPDAQVDTEQNRHDYAKYIRSRLNPSCWERTFRFAVIRSPWEIVASMWRLAKRDVAAMATDPVFAAQQTGWTEYLRQFALDQDFDHYVERDVLGGVTGVAMGGFWRTWCCGRYGKDLGVTPYRYARLRDDWPVIAAKCGCRDLELPHLNGTSPEPAPWTRTLVQQVGHYCWEDIQRFGYQPPECKQ
jgi:hypothetical protein